MKQIVIALITLVSLSATAETIRYEWPSVGELSVNNACVDGDTFRSLNPVKKCERTEIISRTACRYAGEVEVCRQLRAGEKPRIDERVETTTRCAEYSNEHVVVSRETTETVCVKWAPASEADVVRCTQWEERTTYIGTNFKVPMYKNYNGEIGEVYVGTMDYTVPQCN